MYVSISTLGALTATAIEFVPPSLTRAVALSPYNVESILKGGDSNLERWSSLIGIITAIVGNILISFALNIQRYAHIRLNKEQEERKEKSRQSSRSRKSIYGATGTIQRNGAAGNENNGNGHAEIDALMRQDSDESIRCDDDDHLEETSYLRSPYWWSGIALMTVGETGNFLAYGFAPASIVSPLGVVALISNCVIAPIMLKERFRWRDGWGVLIAVGGAVTVVLSAKQEEKRLGPHQIIDAITRTEFEVYMGITIVLMIILVQASPRYGNKTILIDLGLVGLFGGYTALSTKGVASMLSSTLFQAFTTPVTYGLIAVLVTTAVLQVKYVNKALQRFDSTQVIPVQFVMFTLSVIIGSAVLYRDFERATVESMSKFVGGCLLTFFGVFLITSGRSQHDDGESDDGTEEDEGEERIGLHMQDSNTYETFHRDDESQYSTQRQHRGTRDGVDDEEEDYAPSQSRRSSRVSFAPTPSASRPQTPRFYSNSSLRLSTGNNESSPLLSNPWKNSADSLPVTPRPHPGISTTASQPVVPSHATSSSSLLPLPYTPLSRTQSHQNPHTHPNLQQGGPPQADPDVARRPSTPHYSLGQSLIPGPYLSPLSAGLSAVVADTARRGLDKKNSIRRPRLGSKRSKSSTQMRTDSENGAQELELATSPSKSGAISSSFSKLGSWIGGGGIIGEGESSEAQERRYEERMKKSRSRSLSNTLEGLLRSKRQRRESASGDDVEGYEPGRFASQRSSAADEDITPSL